MPSDVSTVKAFFTDRVAGYRFFMKKIAGAIELNIIQPAVGPQENRDAEIKNFQAAMQPIQESLRLAGILSVIDGGAFNIIVRPANTNYSEELVQSALNIIIQHNIPIPADMQAEIHNAALVEKSARKSSVGR